MSDFMCGVPWWAKLIFFFAYMLWEAWLGRFKPFGSGSTLGLLAVGAKKLENNKGEEK